MARLRPSLRHRAQLAGQRIADAIFPPLCLGCQRPLEERPSPTLLCVVCRGRFVPVDPRTSCAGCLRPLPPETTGTPRCLACRSEPGELDRLLAVWLYQPPLSEAILALKFRRLDFLADALAELGCGRQPFAGGATFDLLVPVPLAPLRRLLRGFNQAERIARVVGARLGVPVGEALRRSDLLVAAQSRLGRAARRRAATGRYRTRAPGEVVGRCILLVDDVVTTGTTLRAGARALLDAGARQVTGFALAATPARSWRAPAP